MRVVPVLRAGHRRTGRHGVKAPVVRRAGMMVNARPVSSRVAVSVANARRVAPTVSAVRARRDGSKAAATVANALRAARTASVAKARRAGLKAAATAANALRVVLTVSAVRARRAGLKAAATAANALRVVLTASAAKAHRDGLKAAATAANALRAARTASAAKAHRDGLKAAATAANALRAARTASAAKAHHAASKAAPIVVTARRAVSKATVLRDATTANAARSATVRARTPVGRRKADRVANVRHVTLRIGRASAPIAALRKNVAAASVGRAATAPRVVLKASAAHPGMANAVSQSQSKAAMAIARTVRRAHHATTAANAHRPNVNSANVRHVPADLVNARLAASTRHSRPPAAALATIPALPAPTNRAAQRPQPEPNAAPTMPRRARRAAITKTHRVPSACPS
jgi:hypothetical protein